jgi:YD repeat-containing protein
MTSKTYPDQTAAGYVYDLVGKIQQVSDPTGTCGFAYDNMGRLTGTTTQYTFLPGHNFQNGYSYDAASNRTSLTAPDGSTNSYNYDTLNRLTTLTNSLTGQFGFGYDALSRRTQLTRPNGVNTNYNYDSVSHLLSVLHQAGSTTLDGAGYGYDFAGNRTSKTNYLNGITSNHGYDAIYELLQVTQGGSTTENYSYDAVGNRLSSTGVPTYSYNSSNELTSNSSGSYTYDANGNTLSEPSGKSYTWDFENRMVSAVVPGTGTVTFKYDPFGRRIQKSGPLGTTNYLYDGPNIIEELDQSATVLARYSQGANIDEPLAELRSSTATYYEADGLGSVTSLTNSSAMNVGTYTYDGFGKLTGSTGSLINPPANNTAVYTFSTSSTSIHLLTQGVENQGSGTPLRTTIYCYNTPNPTVASCPTAYSPVFPLTQTDVFTTLSGMSAYSRVSKIFDSYGNLTRTAIYDFGASTPTRTIDTPVGNYQAGTGCVAIGSSINSRTCWRNVWAGNVGGTLFSSTNFTYNSTGNLVTKSDQVNVTGTATYLNTTFQPNTNGTVAWTRDANQNQTTIAYGACNSGMPTKITLPNTLYSQIGWDSGCNGAVVTSTKNLAGNSTSTTYDDPFWRIKSFTDEEQNQKTISYGYNPPTVESILNFGSSTIDLYKQTNVTVLTAYSQKRESPSSSNWDTVQSGYQWGTTGKTTSVSIPCATSQASGCTTGITTTTHDALGRPLVQTDGGNGTVTFTYTGSSNCTSSLPGCLIKSVTIGPAPAGEVVKKVEQEYNGLGQLVASCAISSATGSKGCGFGGYTGFPTAYVYNGNGTVASISKSSNTKTQTRSSTYDGLGRTLTSTYPESGLTTYVYDNDTACSVVGLTGSSNGDLISKTDANSNKTCYNYDALHRLPDVAVIKGSACIPPVKRFRYDTASNGVLPIPPGYSATNTGGRMIS